MNRAYISKMGNHRPARRIFIGVNGLSQTWSIAHDEFDSGDEGITFNYLRI